MMMEMWSPIKSRICEIRNELDRRIHRCGVDENPAELASLKIRAYETRYTGEYRFPNISCSLATDTECVRNPFTLSPINVPLFGEIFFDAACIVAPRSRIQIIDVDYGGREIGSR